MILTEDEAVICRKFSERDEEGYVRCPVCPLAVDKGFLLCKANMTEKEWEDWKENEK